MISESWKEEKFKRAFEGQIIMTNDYIGMVKNGFIERLQILPMKMLTINITSKICVEKI